MKTSPYHIGHLIVIAAMLYLGYWVYWLFGFLIKILFFSFIIIFVLWFLHRQGFWKPRK